MKASLALALALSAPVDPVQTGPLLLPEKAQTYPNAKYTQNITILTDETGRFDRIRKVPRHELEVKWQVPGGMVGIQGWKVEKYKTVPGPVKNWLAAISVKNSFGSYQDNIGLKRSYPNGSRFDEVLKNEKGEVFEHRIAEKIDGKWKRYVAYTNEQKRPPRYKGLEQSCASCHDKAGTGEYNKGLIPGGDTILSEELDWSLIRNERIANPQTVPGALQSSNQTYYYLPQQPAYFRPQASGNC